MFAARYSTFAFVVSFLSGGFAIGAPTPLKPTNTWTGSVADTALEKKKPENGVIANAKDFEKLIKAWKVVEKVPEVNFDKEIILVETTVGSKLNLRASLDDKGDLKAVGLGTRDFGPGFRYVIVSVPKTGVKTVNGKALPKTLD